MSSILSKKIALKSLRVRRYSSVFLPLIDPPVRIISVRSSLSLEPDKYKVLFPRLSNSLWVALRRWVLPVNDLPTNTKGEYCASKYIMSEIDSNERQIAISLLGDYKKASDKYFNDIKHSQDLVWYFKNELTTRPVAGCAFTFYTDNGLVKTTTVDEALFVQGYPKSVATGNTGGRLYITTKLPIEVNEDGQVKKVLTLSCNSQDLPISRIDNNTIGTSISQSGIRRQCVFTYSGNGNNLLSLWLDFNF